jgi:hypothetical protein
LNRRASTILACLGLSASAAAQSFTSGSEITFALHWQDTGNHNGILEPGESALLGLDVSFSNQFTVATFSPLIGSFGSGTIRGFGAGFIDLRGDNAAAGTWDVDQTHGYGVSPDWDLTGGSGNGAPTMGGAVLTDLVFGQTQLGSAPISTRNPIPSIWRGLWTPADYAARTVTFGSGGSPAMGNEIAYLLLRLSASSVGSPWVIPQNLNLGTVAIPIVPGSATITLLAAGLLVLRRHRPGDRST